MRLASLISGSGSTMARTLQAVKSGELLGAEMALVIASKSTVGGIEKARLGGLAQEQIVVINPRDFPHPDSFGQSILDHCREHSIDLILQQGWLPLTPEKVIKSYSGMIINQHPGALDPGNLWDFGGKHMHGRAVHCAHILFAKLTNSNWFTEATVHYVDPEFDKGSVIGRVPIKIDPKDDPLSLAEKLLPVEHALQIKVIRSFVEGKVEVLKRQKPLIKFDYFPQIKQAKYLAHLVFPNG
ncbi:MAG: hypothetical protein KBC48_02140 [Candidatus Pacebacteria bacterium]|nr:hypothetical protein [Candidatus Paceibacterota bacterium]